MEISAEKIRGYRLRAHHLDRRLPAGELEAAAGACGLQNSPPGAWETALFHRVQGCTLPALDEALCARKELLQAWSYRGAPVVFPTRESGVFLSALAALPGEEPWVYTRGVSAALEFLGLSFDRLLPLVKEAAAYLDSHTVKSKEALDRTLAALVAPRLPAEKRPLWDAPSMYGAPDRQTVGGAVVSFLLRPCAFASLVVFGRRQDGSPTFTSFQNWTGGPPQPQPDTERELVRRFLRCYGPAARGDLAAWLGCSPRQAARLWGGVADELEPVRLQGKTRYLLASERQAFDTGDGEGQALLLLGPHDPYLDLRDRAVVLPDPALQRRVWKTVANPGAVLKGGRIVGVWQAKAAGGGLEARLSVWEALTAAERRSLEQRAEEYAAFRRLPLRGFALEEG